MVIVKAYSGEVKYPNGESVQLTRKEPFVLRVIGKDGKVVATHRDWESYSIDDSFRLSLSPMSDSAVVKGMYAKDVYIRAQFQMNTLKKWRLNQKR